MKAVISYFAVLFSAFFYMIFFDAKSGAVMLFFLLAAVVISVFLTVKIRKHISCSFTVTDMCIKKHTGFPVIIKAVKNTILPVPVVTVYLSTSAGLEKLKYSQYRFSMAEKKELEIELNVTPLVSGPSEITIEKIDVSDYLGIFRFKVKNFSRVSGVIYAEPDIPEMESNSDLLRMICDSVVESDDESDHVSSSLPGLPGYEYREYMPGDSLRKVNWKLSSKKNKLYVRLDEAAGVCVPNIILDNTIHNDKVLSLEELIVRDRVTEASLAVLNCCVQNNVSCTFSFLTEGANMTEEINSREDVEKTAQKLGVTAAQNGMLVYEGKEKKKTASMNIIFASVINPENIAFSEEIIRSGNNVRFVIPYEDADHAAGSQEIWLVKPDYSIVRGK